MAKSFAWMIAGAVLVTAGTAHAQEAGQNARESAELPWYQRFTSSTGLTESLTEADRIAPPTWSLAQRWGVTVELRDGERVQPGVDRTLRQQDEASVGAYYQFTPRVRLGGELSLGAPIADTPAVRPSDEAEPTAGVRIQSAFSF